MGSSIPDGVGVPVYMEDGEVIFTMSDSAPTIRSDPTQRVYTISLPMRIQTSSKKQTALNLNIYRNLHHRSHHALKTKFEQLAADLLEDTPPLGRIRLHYSVRPRTKRRLDIANVCSVIDKYFSDALTKNGVIEDDDYTNLDFVSFGFGGLAEDEHVLVTITEIEQRKKTNMRILLDNAEVQNALDAFVLNELGLTGATGVLLQAEEDGTFSAEVLMGETIETPKPGPKPKAKRRTKAQIEADKKAAEEEANGADDTTVSGGPDSDDGGSDQNEEAGTPSGEEAAETSEDRKPKNDSKESPEESSSTDGAEEKAEEKPVAPKKKKSSIFAP